MNLNSKKNIELNLSSFIDIFRSNLNHEIRALNLDILSLMHSLGAKGDNIDVATRELAKKDRSLLSSVYDVVREMASFHQLVFAPGILAAVRNLLGEGPLHSPYQHAVFRMDMPQEPFRSFDWHQDYPYNMLSQNALTAWIPLAGAGEFNGSIDVVLKKDEKIYPVDIKFKRTPDGQIIGGRDAFITKDYADGFESSSVKLEMQSGDFALFGSHIVHKSGLNPGPNVRFSVQIRYGKLLDPQLIQRRWANRRSDGFDTFSNIHPNLVASKEQA